MSSFNKVIQLGNLTRDPELKYAPNGMAVARFAIAVNSRVKRGDGWEDKVDYFDVVTFGKTAENCNEYLNRGDSVLIEGKLNQQRWDDKATGQKRSKVEIYAQTVTFMPKRQQGKAPADKSAVPNGVSEAFPSAAPVDEGDIPF